MRCGGARHRHVLRAAGVVRDDELVSEMPQITESDFVERNGVIEVARIVNDEARCIWRETIHRDIRWPYRVCNG
jgi:hypothetical protein